MKLACAEPAAFSAASMDERKLVSYSIGDVTFSNTGQPGVIVARKDNQDLEVDQSKKTVRETHKFGYINGLSDMERKKLHESLEKLSELPIRERVTELRKTINQIEDTRENVKLKDYLKAELAHIMYSHNIQPRFYVKETL